MRYSHEELRIKHPELASSFEKILRDNPKIALRLKYLYYSQYATGKRPDKALTLGRIIKECEAAGYKIDIKTSL